MATAPAREILSGAIEVYWAPVDEAFPDLADAPAGNWVLIGKSGSKNITEDGVTIRHPQALEIFRMLGSTGPRVIARSSEDLFVDFVLADLQSDEYALALDNDTSRVTDTAPGVGTAGNLNQPLLRGPTVHEVALLLKKDPGSAELSGGASQWEIPRVVQVGEPAPAFVKNAPAAQAFSYQAIEDVTEGFGQIRIEDAVAV